MKVPQQFYLNRDAAAGLAEGQARVGDLHKYFSGEGEGSLKLAKDKKQAELLARSGSVMRAPATVEGGHPLVPRLNLPQDSNQQFREYIMQQAQVLNEDSSEEAGPSSSSEWESSEEEMEEEGEQSALEENKIPEEEKNQAAPRELVPHGQ